MVTTPAPDDDVEKILTGLMSKQSPLMKQARTQGIQQAQNVGLGQSTAGIKAAQAAAYNAAMPIASQQAQQGLQKNMQTAQFGHETGMQTRGFQHAASQAELDRAHQVYQMNIGTTLDMQKMQMQQNFEASQNQAQRQMQERLASMEMSARNKEVALNAATQMNQAFSQSYAQIAQNHELPADVRNSLLQHLEAVRTHTQNISAATFRYDIPW